MGKIHENLIRANTQLQFAIKIFIFQTLISHFLSIIICI